jgi:hypothetical protein
MSCARPALLLVGAVIIGTALYQWALRPSGNLLVAEHGAQWIKRRSWTDPKPHLSEPVTHTFRLRFFVAVPPPSALATIETLGRHRVRVNGELLPAEGIQDTARRQRQDVDLAPFLMQRSNEILIEVESTAGPPALRLYAVGAEISTGENAWEVSANESLWEPASLASEKLPIPQGTLLGSRKRVPRALPWIGLLFVLGCIGTLLSEHARFPAALRTAFEPSNLRWLCFAAWGILSANNLMHLPWIFGFDSRQHLEYVTFLIENGRIPYADEGWQMFQPPLAYLLAAPVFATLSALAGPQNGQHLLRLLSLACGIGQIEICYRAGKAVFPERSDLQRLALLVGGFLPMNIYISQAFGNEPVSGVLTASLVLICVKLLAGAPLPPSRISLSLGLLFGLALLAKVTAVVMLPALALCLLWTAEQRGLSRGAALGLGCRTLLLATAVAGWYYARNWLHFGRPFVGGWDPSRGLAWWQDPGYRVPSDFYTFGAALMEPIYAGVHGVWDGLYSTLWLDGYLSGAISPLPPWNYDLLVSMSLLSIPLSIALLAGIARTLLRFRERELRPLLFGTVCVACFAAALVLLYLEVPTYSSSKATYALGITPCIALLSAAGLAPVLGSTPGRALVGGYVCCWLGINYAAYFVR